MKKIFLLFFYPFSLMWQEVDLVNGPMVGHTSAREVKIWLQTKEEATIVIAYSPKDEQKIFKTEKIWTKREDAYTGVVTLDQVKPNTAYRYSILLNDQKVSLPQKLAFKTPPIYSKGAELPEFSLAFGSCVFINDSTTDPIFKGGEYKIFQAIADKSPDMMFWLGDNIYLRPEDWSSNTGFKYRYTHTRNVPEMRELLSSVSNYAIWDDHDFGPNDSDRSYIHKDLALHWFSKFWANPSYGLTGYGLSKPTGIVSSFAWGDVDFFLTDNRYFRTPQKRITGEKTVLGKVQLDWLIDALKFSEANVKVVVMGSLFLSSSSNVKNQNYISNYSEERAHLLSKIEEEQIENVIFITGDKHFSEVSKYVDANRNTIYEFTSSPLTAQVNTREDDNTYRIPGSHIQQRNFGWIEFRGKTLEDRYLIVSFLSSAGKELYKQEIKLIEP